MARNFQVEDSWVNVKMSAHSFLRLVLEMLRAFVKKFRRLLSFPPCYPLSFLPVLFLSPVFHMQVWEKQAQCLACTSRNAPVLCPSPSIHQRFLCMSLDYDFQRSSKEGQRPFSSANVRVGFIDKKKKRELGGEHGHVWQVSHKNVQVPQHSRHVFGWQVVLPLMICLWVYKSEAVAFYDVMHHHYNYGWFVAISAALRQLPKSNVTGRTSLPVREQ